jgi:hypothetical protein
MSASLETYCQFLLTSPFNYTQTYFADHVNGLSHDKVNRVLKSLKVTASDLWEAIGPTVTQDSDGYLLFDDTVLDKRHSFNIEGVRPQYSGNAHGVIKGIGVVTCVYVNPKTQQFWGVDYRIFDPEHDGKSKLDHVQDMLVEAGKRLQFKTVLMDSWYASRALMVAIDAMEKIYYTVVKPNRLIAEHRGKHAYQAISSIDWTKAEYTEGSNYSGVCLVKGKRSRALQDV